MAEEVKTAEQAERYVHVLILGVGGTTREVSVVTDSPRPPKPFVEFIDGFRSGKRDLIWSPNPKNPVFAIRLNSIDFYEYRAGPAKPAEDKPAA